MVQLILLLTMDGLKHFLKVTIPAYFLPRTTRGVELALGVGVCARAGVCAVDMDDIDAPDGVGSSSLFKT